MNATNREDDDLRRRFQALAASDARSTPALSRTMRAARARAARASAAEKATRRRWITAGLLGAVATAAAAIIVVKREPPPLIDLSTAHWVAPTDFLLNTPGRSLLRTVPGFSVTPFESSARAASPRRTTPRNDS
jgi:hypothetical protein